MPDKPNYYAVLGVSPAATAAEIAAAYRAKAREHHPDAGGSDEEMAAINEAYATLSDPVLRERYDADDGFSDLAGDVATILRAVTGAFGKADLATVFQGDVIAGMRRMVEEKIRVEASGLPTLDAELGRLERWKGRFIKVGGKGQNRFEAGIDAMIEETRGRIKAKLESVAHFKRILAFLDDYSFVQDSVMARRTEGNALSSLKISHQSYLFTPS